MTPRATPPSAAAATPAVAPGGPDELERAFGEPVSRVSELNWGELARRLGAYVARPDRTPVEDYGAIRRALQERWSLPVVETPHEVGAMSPLGEADPDYGRCGVRLLDFLRETRVYLVIRQVGDPGGGRMLWALLHELGHFVNHFEMLLSLGTLYQRVCLDPSLEIEVGRFAREAASPLHARRELEADLFALDWLLPVWVDDDEALRRNAVLTDRLTPDGYRLYRLRCALDAPFPLPAEPEAVAALNRAGAGERARARGAYPHSGTRWARACWLLFRRREVRGDDAESAALRRAYYRVAGYPPRHIPELTRRTSGSAAVDPELVWLKRVAPEGLAAEVDAARWAPVLVPSSTSTCGKYHIPVRPVPAQSGRDSELGWVHMSWPGVPKQRPLAEWLDRAASQAAGLLAFPRNPAELTLDREGQARE